MTGGRTLGMHKVTPLDNLAGLAIKYGVTIRDIKRANGGVISDATLFARGTLRIPRHALPGEGAPLPGGGGVTGELRSGASEAAGMTPAVQKMRAYYGLKPPEEEDGSRRVEGAAGDSSTSDRVGAAGKENAREVHRAFAGGSQSVKKVTRSSSGGDVPSSGSGWSGGDSGGRQQPAAVGGGAEGRYGTALGNGAMSETAFQGRERALMSPPKVMTSSGAATAPGAAKAGSGKGFFARLKALANAPSMATAPSAPSLGAAVGGIIDQRPRGFGGGGGVGRVGISAGGGGGSNLPAGRKGKGD